MDVTLSSAHWVYLFGVIAIVVTMALRANVVVPAIIATFEASPLRSGGNNGPGAMSRADASDFDSLAGTTGGRPASVIDPGAVIGAVGVMIGVVFLAGVSTVVGPSSVAGRIAGFAAASTGATGRASRTASANGRFCAIRSSLMKPFIARSSAAIPDLARPE